MDWRIVLIGVWVLGPWLYGCEGNSEARRQDAGEMDVATRYQVLAPDTRALQTAFNSDSGKVRAIFLASPT